MFRLRLSGLFSSGFPTKTLHAFLFSPMPYLVAFIARSEDSISWKFSLYSFLLSPVTSSLLGRNVSLSTLFSNTLNTCSTAKVGDKSCTFTQNDKQCYIYQRLFIHQLLHRRIVLKAILNLH